MADTEINGAEVLAEILSKWESNGFEGEPSLDGLSAEEKEAVYKYTIDPKAKLNEYGTHIKDAIQTDLGDARAAELQAEVAAANPPATDENDDKPADEGSRDDGKKAEEEEKYTIDDLEASDREFIENINTDEQKVAIKKRSDTLDAAFKSLTMDDVLAGEDNEIAKRLNNFFKNVTVQGEEPGSINEDAKSDVYDAAIINATRDLVKDEEIDKLLYPAEGETEEQKAQREAELKKRLHTAILENMESISFQISAVHQVGEELNKEDFRQLLDEHLHKSDEADADTPVDFHGKSFDELNAMFATLCSNDCPDDKKITVNATNYTTTMAATVQDARAFGYMLAEKTGARALLDRVKGFDKKMSEKYPVCWNLAKGFVRSQAILAAGGLGAMTAYGIYKTVKAGKDCYNDYKTKKAEGFEGGFLAYAKQNKGKVAGVVAAGVGSTITVLSVGLGNLSDVENWGAIGKVMRDGIHEAYVSSGLEVGETVKSIFKAETWESMGRGMEFGYEHVSNTISRAWDSVATAAMNPLDTAKDIAHNITDKINWGNATRMATSFSAGMINAVERLRKGDMKGAKGAFLGALAGTGMSLGFMAQGTQDLDDIGRQAGNADVFGNEDKGGDFNATDPKNLESYTDKIAQFKHEQQYDLTGQPKDELVNRAAFQTQLEKDEIAAGQEQYDKNHDSVSPYAPGEHPANEEYNRQEQQAQSEAKAAEEQAKAEQARQSHQNGGHHGGGHHNGGQSSEDKQLEEKIRKDWEDAVKQSEEAIKNGEIGPAPEPAPAPAPEPKVEIVDEVVRPEDANLGETKEVFRAEGVDGSVVTAEESKEGIKYTSKDAEGKTETREVILQRDSDGKASGYYGIAETDNNGEIERRNMTHDEVKTVMANYHHITDHGDAKGASLNNLEDQIEQGNHRVLPHQTTEVTVNEGNDGNTDGAQPEATQEVMPKEQAENLQKTLQSSHGMYQPEGRQIINSEVENVVVATYVNGVAITATADVQTEAPLQPTQFVQNSETGQLEEKPILDAKGQRAYDPLTMSKNDIVSMGVDAKSGHSLATITDEDGTHKMTVEEFKTAEQLMIKSLPEQQLNGYYAEADRAFRIDHFNEDPKLYGELAAKTLGSENLTVVAVPDGHGVAAFSDHGISSASLENRTTTVAQIGQDGKIHVYEQTPAEAYRGYSLDGKTENVGLPGREITGEKAQQFVRDAVKVYDKAGQGNAAFVNAARDHGWLQEQQQQQKTGELTGAQMRQMEARQGGRR